MSETLPGMTAIGLPAPDYRIDLTPASWIWYPSTRTLPNTVVLFRRRVNLPAPVRKASGWITADSRYLLVVNGQRVQWGPAPSDPRRMEVDPLDLTTRLVQGENVIAATVLYYGHGDGTHPIGKPGFICTLTIECTDGSTVTLTSNQEWQCHLATSWPPGQYKRWYLRSLGRKGDRELRLRVPAGIEAELRLDRKENVALTSVPQAKDVGYSVYSLPSEKEILLQLKYT